MSKTFQDRYGLHDGESIINLGPPGTGKSYFAGSVCGVIPPERTLLMCPKPREKTSALYRKYGLSKRAVVYSDLATWDPENGNFGATAWKKLLTHVQALLSDTKYDAIIVDPFTDAVDLLEHYILAPHKVGSPGELQDTQGFYRQLRDKSNDFVQRLTALTDSQVAASPKFVIVTMHTQPPKDTVNLRGGATKASQDQRAEGVEYEGKVLPQMEGSYRRKMAGDFGIVLYSDVEDGSRMNSKTKKMEKFTDFRVQIRCSKERHAKMAPIVAEDMPEYLPNDFKVLYDYLVAGEAQDA